VSSREINNDDGVRLVNFATSKNSVVKSTMFPHRGIHEYTWTSPDGKTHNHIGHILIDRRRHKCILDVSVADCDSGHYLIVAKVRERLAVNKRIVEEMDMERFNVKQLNEKEVKEQYEFTIKDNFATLENLGDNGDMNRVWKTIRENKNFVQGESGFVN
jgi:hypothetical protein